MKEFVDEIKLQIPDVELIDAPDDKFPIYRIDGRHYTAASGLQFFNYLMDRAELPYSDKMRTADAVVTKLDEVNAARP